jgi:hypothetical protein
MIGLHDNLYPHKLPFVGFKKSYRLYKLFKKSPPPRKCNFELYIKKEHSHIMITEIYRI